VRGRLLLVEPRGRNRYFRLASPEVTEVLKALVAMVLARQRRGESPP
jgi:hypothetical protein